MSEIHAVIFLFFVAVISANFLPSQAELLLFALLAAGDDEPLLLVVAATLGNVIGGLGNYYAGFFIRCFEKKKWFPIKKKYIQKAQRLFDKHGTLTLLLAGVPFVGGPILVAAGMMRIPLWLFLPLVTVGKAVRYLLVWAVYALLR